MTIPTSWAAIAGLFALSLGHWWWRRLKAREIAEQWLHQHRYRVRSLRVSYPNPPPRIPTTPLPHTHWAVDARPDDDHVRLAGTGKLRLPDWTDGFGIIDRDPEISWDQMPTEDNGGARAPESQWLDAQVALLRRIADGESTFQPEGRDAVARTKFDETVEHLLAMQRRGLVKCSTPMAELRADAQYSAITDVEITDDGRRALDRANEAQRPAPQP